jgi:ketosteroid isomerase-like protein
MTRKTNEAFDAGIEALLLLYAADVVCYPAPGWVQDAVVHGHDGIRTLSAVWSENFDDVAMEVHEVRDLQQRLVILAEFTGRARDTGAPIRQPFGVVNSHIDREGKVGEVRFFLSWREALEAVGLAT